MIGRLCFFLFCGFAIFYTRLPCYHERGKGTKDCVCSGTRLVSSTHDFWLTFSWPEFSHMQGKWHWSPAVEDTAVAHDHPSCLCHSCLLFSFIPAPFLCNLSFLLLQCRTWQCSPSVETLRKLLKIYTICQILWILNYVNLKSVI